MTLSALLSAAVDEAVALENELVAAVAQGQADAAQIAALTGELDAARRRVAELEAAVVQPPAVLGFPGPGTVGHTVAGRPLHDAPPGDYTMRPGEVIDHLRITGRLITADGAVARYCDARLGTVLTAATVPPRLEWCTLGPDHKIEGTVDWKILRRVVQSNGPAELFRCELRGMVDLLFAQSTDVTVRECWGHANYYMAVDPSQDNGRSHPDFLQTWNARRWKILNSRIDAFSWGANDTFDQYLGKYGAPGQVPMTSAFLAKPSNKKGDVVDDIEVSGNLVDGYAYNLFYGASQAVTSPTTDGTVNRPTNIRYLNNRIRSKGVVSGGRILSGAEGVTWQGNVDADTGAPISQAQAQAKVA